MKKKQQSAKKTYELHNLKDVLSDKESPAAKYFDSPQAGPIPPPGELKSPTKPFDVDFNIDGDNYLSFRFVFHGFKE